MQDKKTIDQLREAHNLLIRLTSCDNNMLDEVLDVDIMKKLKEKEYEALLAIHPYSIYKSESENAWRTYITDYKDGKQIRRAIKRKTEEALKDYLVDYYLNLNMTLEMAFQRWVLYRRDETPVKTKTIKENIYDWNAFFKDAPLAKYKLTDITTQDLYKLFRKLTKNRAYTHHRIGNAHGVLNGIFSWAIENGKLDQNPLLGVNLKQFTYKPIEEQINNVYSEEEVMKLDAYLQPITDEPYALAIRLFFNLFIRIGELKAIRMEDINETEQTVYIHTQALIDYELNDDLTFSKRKHVVSETMKGYTSRGFRKEHLNKKALGIIRTAKQLNPDGIFLFESNGKPMLTDTFNDHLKRYCQKCGIKYYPSHKIRFYCASKAYKKGRSLDSISVLMGHSQLATTAHYLRNIGNEEECAETCNCLDDTTKEHQNDGCVDTNKEPNNDGSNDPNNQRGVQQVFK